METTKKIDVIIEKHTYEFNKKSENWILALRKSEVQVNEEKDLALLLVSHPLLMETRIQWEDDAVTFTYELPKERITFNE